MANQHRLVKSYCLICGAGVLITAKDDYCDLHKTVEQRIAHYKRVEELINSQKLIKKV